MAKHKLKIGIDFINNLKTLGTILGYYVNEEFPVTEEGEGSSAMDLAWFKDKKQKFPLFIFEIESTITNGMAYNPMKVFSKDNLQLEKPLFFFHLILSRGQNSERIKDLRAQYGTYNYRIYRLSVKEQQDFLRDVLSQHRRISDKLQISKLFYFLIESKWLSIDIEKIANFIVDAEFERRSGKVLSSYIYLSSIYPSFHGIASNLLEIIHKDYYENSWVVEYQTYYGNTWHMPIHLGIIYATSSDLYTKIKAFEKLQNWQKGEYMSKIGPHFNLSYDYDSFIIWGAGGVFGLLASLFIDNARIRLYFAEELLKIIESTAIAFRFNNVAWLMHILPNTIEGDLFYKSKVKKELKLIGGLSAVEFINPIFSNEGFDFERSKSKRSIIRSLGMFNKKISEIVDLEYTNPTSLACEILVSENVDSDIGFRIVKAIHFQI